jgi:hypothetical protein
MPEHGTYQLSVTHTGLHYVSFYGTDDQFGTILIDRYQWQVDGGSLWLRKTSSTRWFALAPFADEALCDGSGGKWLDDDANAHTGLYCECPSSSYWIPARGGCAPRK